MSAYDLGQSADLPRNILQIPDEVTDYYLQRSGFETDDVRV